MMQLDEQLLGRAADQTIRPSLIVDGRLEDPDFEGYHHGRIIPKAQPRLTREALDHDAIGAVTDAIKAAENLLSQYEHMWPVAFLADCDPSEARDHLVDLLYGEDELAHRIRRFLAWGGYRKRDDGSKAGFNGTIASYLLAVSNPVEYAFCKPTVYRAAAKALLGPDQVVKDQAERVAHAQRFYAEALKRLRDQHHLPFDDLMHVHIAFYVVKAHNNYPGWEDLMNGEPIDDRQAAPSAALNTVLYGPPGTGKTYEAIRLAVELCDGTVPEDRSRIVERYRQLRNDGRIGFVTFHQSYGYEDFVEGIRPVISDEDDEGEEAASGEVVYECRKGVFRRMCDFACLQTHKPSKPVAFDVDKTPVWKMSLGNTRDPDQADIYEACIEGEFLHLGWGKGLDYTGCDDRDQVLEKLRRDYDREIKSNDYNVTSVDCFKNRMGVGDLVVISKGNHNFRAIGRVTGEYQFSADDRYAQTRPVEWLYVADDSVPREKILTKAFAQPAIYRLHKRVLKAEALAELLSTGGPAWPVNHVLVIDEINRGNIAKILGELITLIEPDKRIGGPEELMVTLPYSGATFGVPANLYIIGTMNTADRSIAFLDTALRRRFRFRELMPDADVVRHIVGDDGEIDGIDVAAMLESINRRIELLYDRDHQVGHSYFLMVEDLQGLRDVFVRDVIPLLQEYFYGDWERVCAVLGCPFEPETGRSVGRNGAPMIRAERLDAAELSSVSGDDVPDRVRCAVNPQFMAGSPATLAPYFEGLIGAAPPGETQTP